MRQRWFGLLVLVLSGCAGFDDYYYDQYPVYGPVQPPCGYNVAPAPPQTAPPPLANTTVSSSVAPQSREPELLR